MHHKQHNNAGKLLGGLFDLVKVNSVSSLSRAINWPMLQLDGWLVAATRDTECQEKFRKS